MTPNETGIPMLRHMLATIHYRAESTFKNAHRDFDTFDLGYDVRTPLDILTHMADVLSYAHKVLNGTALAGEISVDWQSQQNRFHSLLNEIDRTLADQQSLQADTANRLLQGPLADLLTHIGQLAMLRRCAGSPVPGQNFFAADVQPISKENS